MEERTCRGCGQPMPKGPRERNPRKWCRETCRMRWWRTNRPDEWAAIVRRKAERDKARGAALRPECANCGQRVKKVGAVYCSEPECDRAGKAARARARYAEDKEAGRQRVYAARAARTPEQIARDREKSRADGRARGYTESKRSAYARRRALKRGAQAEKFTNGEIFDRDGWRCGICGKRINRRLVYPHPLSVSLDHVIPLSLGGEHSRANVRAAHLTCNIQRGAAREGVDQLALL